MLRIFKRSKDESAKTTVPRKLRPALEGLEERRLLYATLGDAWTYPVRVTFSFVPDGTNVGGLSSNLTSTLNSVGTTAAWQLAFQKSAAYWSTNANINMAQVPDNGADLSGTGNQQGDPNFGDIRIAMANQGNNGVLASTFLPPKSNGGSLAGDIVFNSYYSFNLNSGYDLQTVAIHELGHALGLAHSTVSTADMYAYYQGLRQSPTADDISGIQAVYGTTPTDTDTNTTINSATNITSLMTSNGQVSLGNLSIAKLSDQDWFYVTAPANTTGSMTVTMQGAGLSMVNPRMTVYNSAKTGIAQNQSNTNFGGNATVTITGVTAGQGFYVRASPATSPGATGAYGLLVNFGSATQALIAPPFTTVAAAADQGGGSLGQSTTSQIIATDAAEMRLSQTQLSTNKSDAIETLTTDTFQLLGILKNSGDTTSGVRKTLIALSIDLATSNIPKVTTDLNRFLENVVQIGTLTGFGENYTVRPAHNPTHSSHGAANPSDPSGGTVIGIPPASGETHKTKGHPHKGAQHHPSGPAAHQSNVRAAQPVSAAATGPLSQQPSTAMRIRHGR